VGKIEADRNDLRDAIADALPKLKAHKLRVIGEKLIILSRVRDSDNSRCTTLYWEIAGLIAGTDDS
jgi:hypothetical protein